MQFSRLAVPRSENNCKSNGLILLIEIQNEALETVLTRKIKQNLKVARLALKGAKSCTLCKIIFIFVEVAR